MLFLKPWNEKTHYWDVVFSRCGLITISWWYFPSSKNPLKRAILGHRVSTYACECFSKYPITCISYPHIWVSPTGLRWNRYFIYRLRAQNGRKYRDYFSDFLIKISQDFSDRQILSIGSKPLWWWWQEWRCSGFLQGRRSTSRCSYSLC